MAYLSQPLYKILFVVALSCVLNHAANADAYLDMLEGEAEDVKLDQSGQIQAQEHEQEQKSQTTDGITKTNWKWEGDLEGDVLPPGLAQDEFATLLKQNYYGTFVFYRKLNSVDQSTVFYHYSQSTSASLDSIRDDIISHLKQ